MGPVQVLVVGFEDPRFSGEVLAEFARLGEAGIVRLVDLLVVSRGNDGTFRTLDELPAVDRGLGVLAASLLGCRDKVVGSGPDGAGADPSGAQRWSLSDSVPPGSVAAIALIEHLWAGPIKAAINRAGGVPLEEAWLAPEDVDELEKGVAGRPDR